MEVEAALILFQRSLQKHKMRYTTLLLDGDSRAYLALQEARVYGYVPVEKEDCIDHIHKRMGTALRNLISKQKSSGTESLGGKGKLTGELITKLSSYYGWALKSHKGDVKAMHKAVMATYYHITSNDVTSNHSLCPEGPESWCPKTQHRPKVSLLRSTATICHLKYVRRFFPSTDVCLTKHFSAMLKREDPE
ncbi:hypothetical protein HPB52_017116 [Rhipicephalus sanguineus]|uniref:Mutator-like transposase domain-containing protein n=1 Tax=Rhipicephalus sanguineus TaxID=34632 RepID=A0A9D4PNI2_RHISA|nr:hypothetical protein HPB52_017116 [Rhipicephalus sanguineus]